MDQIKCRWCGKPDVEPDDVTRIHIFMPFFSGPRFEITNDLCQECAKAALAALAGVEQAAARGEKV